MNDLVLNILEGLYPLYFLIFIGFLTGKLLKIDIKTVGEILIYTLAPAVVFLGVYSVNIRELVLPVVFFAICSLMSLGAYWLCGLRYKTPEKNIMAFMSGTGNTGYFGIPLVLFLIGDQALPIAVLSTFGFILFENTLGFYLIAKGQFTAKQSLVKLIKLPAVYAFIVGVLFALFELKVGLKTLAILQNFKGAYIVFGMMIVGMALSQLRFHEFDLKFVVPVFIFKFLVWPITILGVILLDKNLIHVFDPSVHKIMALMSCVPVAANSVALASALNIRPLQTSVAVTMSSLLGLITIPISFYFFMLVV